MAGQPANLAGSWNKQTQMQLVQANIWPNAVGQQEYTQGTYTWICPLGVTSVSVVCVGSGANGGPGGALSYKNNITVVPTTSYTLRASSSESNRSYFNTEATVSAGNSTARTGDGGGNGGNYGNDSGGGAGGYSGNGGNGAGPSSSNPGSGGGGGGGRGNNCFSIGGGGGGVGLLGQGANGFAGGGGGSGGSNGSGPGFNYCVGGFGGNGGTFGGGAGYGSYQRGTPGYGGLRIIWPGTTRSFPSTNTGNA